jgi:predicted permease
MFSDLFYRLRALFRRNEVETELDSELRSHFEHAVEKHVRAGATRQEAARRARLELGGFDQVKEECRDARGVRMVETLVQDVRYGVRMLAKTPAITTVALLSLALGIGANTAIFSLIDAVMLRMLPVQNPQELAQVGMFTPKYKDEMLSSFTNPIWEQLRDHQDVFSSAFASWGEKFDLADGGEAQNIYGVYASGDYFSTLGVHPLLGHLFTAADDRRGCGGAAVLGYGFWQQHYGGAESAIGSMLRVSGHSFPVIGVTPPGFFGTEVGAKFDVAIPVCAEAILHGKDSMLDHRSSWWLRVIGRLKPGVSREQAAARLNLLAPRLFAAVLPEKWNPEEQKNFLGRTFATLPAATGLSYLRGDYERPLEVLMFVVGLVLLIACANIASLLLARSAARRQEIAVRLSLGASRARLIRQVLTESIVLSSAGALLGILVARWGGALLLRLVSTHNAQQVFLTLPMDGRALGFTAGIAILTGLLFGMLPALKSTRVSLASAMKGAQAQDAEIRSRFHSGRWIVAVQVALSVILLVGTGLFVRSFRNLVTLDAGFDRNNVLLVDMDIHNAQVPAAGRAQFYAQILERLKQLPGAESAGQCWFSPIKGYEWNDNIQIEGKPPATGDENLTWFNWITPGYLATMRTPILRGRDIDSRDSAGTPEVAVVNETFARKFFPNEDPIGRYFHTVENDMSATSPVQIIGVVKDSKYVSLREEFLPTAYVPLAQMTRVPERSTFEVRSAGGPGSLIPEVREAVAGANKATSLQFLTLAQQVDDSLTQERVLAVLSGFFGGLALLLTAIGLYGVMSYAVTQRTHEIGIRIALGAPRGAVLRLVMRDAALVVTTGTAAGILGSLWITRLVEQLLFGLTPTDSGTTAFAALALGTVALVASYLPARRATRVDPMVALRYE